MSGRDVTQGGWTTWCRARPCVSPHSKSCWRLSRRCWLPSAPRHRGNHEAVDKETRAESGPLSGRSVHTHPTWPKEGETKEEPDETPSSKNHGRLGNRLILQCLSLTTDAT